IGIKDLLSATEGVATSQGSLAFGDWIADHDSAHVRRLREAGAIMVGKTNTPELGLRPVTENARFGATRNPWDPQLSAGGSSGGSASAVASGMVALADGSDLGGSIRIPAACCGLVGLKPSLGRVSIGPDYGDMTGTAQHLVRVIERLHGQPVDPSRLEPATRAWLVDSAPIPLTEYLEAGERLWALTRRLLSGWQDDEVLVTPTLTRLPAPVGGI